MKTSRRLTQLRKATDAEIKKMIPVLDYAKKHKLTVQGVYARIDAQRIKAVQRWRQIFILP